MKKFDLIIAPHPDDEVIGCYQILQEHLEGKADNNLVIAYLYDHSGDVRRRELLDANSKFNSSTLFSFKEIKAFISANVTRLDRIFIPDKYEVHPHHVLVRNEMLALLSTAFGNFPKDTVYNYSIDMRNRDIAVLSPEQFARKRLLLNELYPSQKQLWENNNKYFLFESIRKFAFRQKAKVTYQFDGVHNWPDAGSVQPEVGYLSSYHRHTFNVTVVIDVFHNDRELEYFMVRKILLEFITNKYFVTSNGVYDLGNSSCEMIAEKIKFHLHKVYGWYRDITVEVLEDAANGTICS